MPVVDVNTGQPLSDDPDQEDERLRGGKGRGEMVSATDGPPEGSGVSAGLMDSKASGSGVAKGEGEGPSGSEDTGGA